MNRIPLIRVASIVPIRDFLLRSGTNIDRSLQNAQLPSAVFEHPELLLPYPVVGRFLDHAGRLGGETLGARAGHATPLEALGVFGRRIANAPTLGDALVTAGQVARADYSGESFWLMPSGNDDVRLCHRFPTHLEDPHQQVEQFSLCVALRFLKSIVAAEWQPVVDLKKGMPSGVADLPMLRGSAVVFDQPTWAITFPRSLLHRQLPAPSSAVLKPAELARWKESAPGHNLATTVGQVIRTALIGGDADMGLVASWIGTSTRTLQRRLEDAGVTYAEMLAQARLATATRLLDDRTATMQDIARMLGYSHPAHFTRAFRRWTGCPPRTFRNVRTHESTLLAVNGTRRWRS